MTDKTSQNKFSFTSISWMEGRMLGCKNSSRTKSLSILRCRERTTASGINSSKTSSISFFREPFTAWVRACSTNFMNSQRIFATTSTRYNRITFRRSGGLLRKTPRSALVKMGSAHPLSRKTVCSTKNSALILPSWGRKATKLERILMTTPVYRACFTGPTPCLIQMTSSLSSCRLSNHTRIFTSSSKNSYPTFSKKTSNQWNATTSSCKKIWTWATKLTSRGWAISYPARIKEGTKLSMRTSFWRVSKMFLTVVLCKC